MQLLRLLGHNMFWLALGRIGTMAAMLVVIAVLTRLLGPEGYGEYRSIQALLQFALGFASLGLAPVILREYSVPGADQARILGAAIGLKLALALAAVALAVLGVQLAAYTPPVRGGVLLAALGFLALSVHLTLITVFQERLAQTGQVVSELVGALSLLLLAALAVSSGLGVIGAAAALGLSLLLQTWTSWRYARRHVRTRPFVDAEIWKRLLRAGLPLAVFNLAVLFYYRSDTIMLSLLRPAEAVGLYGVATRIMDSVVGFALLFLNLVLPLLTRARHCPQTFRLYLDNAASALLLALVGVALVLGLFAREISIVLGGSAFAGSTMPLRILLLVGVLASWEILLRYAATALDRQRDLLPGYLLAVPIALAGFVLLIPRLSATGAGLSVLAAELCALGWNLRTVARLTGCIPGATALLKAGVAALVTAASLGLAPVDDLAWPLALVLAAALYTLLLSALGALPVRVLVELLRGIVVPRPGIDP